MYYDPRYRNPKLQKLILEWDRFEYSKFSTLTDQMEWSIMEVLLLEDFELSYVSSTYVEYPSIHYNDINRVEKLVETAKRAKSLMQGFVLPEKTRFESLRLYLARISDQLENHLSSKMDKTDASIAGDYFLSRSIKDPPLECDE